MKSLFPRAIISMLIVAMFVPIFGSAPCESAQRAQAGSSESGPPLVQAATPGAQASQSQPAMVWKPEEAQALLQKIYMAAFRVNDLLTLLRPDQWKMGDAERKSFSQTLDSLRDQLKTLEQGRSQLVGQPRSPPVLERVYHQGGSLIIDPRGPHPVRGMPDAARRRSPARETPCAQRCPEARDQGQALVAQEPGMRGRPTAARAPLWIREGEKVVAEGPDPLEGSPDDHRGQPTARASGSTGTALPVQSDSERRAWKTSSPSPS